MKSQVPHELISAYFDGEATPEERTAVQRLLAESEDARRELNEIAKLSALLHSFPREFAPPQLAVNVERQTSQLPKPVKPLPVLTRNRLRDLKAAMAGGLAACLVIVAFSRMPFSTVKAPHGGAVADNESKVSQGEFFEKSAPASVSPNLAAADSKQAESDKPATIPMLAANESQIPGGMSDAARSLRFGANSVETLTRKRAASNEVAVPAETLAQADPSKEGFLQNLREGNLVQMYDPSSNVAVVDLIVNDVPRGAGELKARFERNDIYERTSGDFKQDDVKKDNVKESGRARGESVVFYVDANGDRLASILFDVDQHPDLFRGWSYQQPLQLELEVAQMKLAESATAKKAADSKLGASKDGQPLVDADAEVAEQAVNKLYERSVERELKVAQPDADGARASDVGRSLSARFKGAGQGRASLENEDLSVRPSLPSVDRAESKNEALGNFQILRRPDLLNSSASSSFRNSSITGSNTPQNSAALSRNSQANQFQNGARNDSDNRVKMLWVLHPADANPPSAAAPPPEK